MKSLISAVLMAVVIIGGCLFYTNKLDDLSLELAEECINILSYIKDDNYDEAKEHTDELDEFLEQKKIILASFIDHNELDKIEMNLEQMKVYIAEENRADSLAYGKALSALFLHFPKNYKVKIENVL